MKSESTMKVGSSRHCFIADTVCCLFSSAAAAEAGKTISDTSKSFCLTGELAPQMLPCFVTCVCKSMRMGIPTCINIRMFSLNTVAADACELHT